MSGAIQDTPFPVEGLTESAINEFVDHINPLLTSIGAIPHVGGTLRHSYPSPIPGSDLRYMDFDEANNALVWRALYGDPSDTMQSLMDSYFEAKRYSVPQTWEQMVWTSILSQHRSSCLSLGKARTQVDVTRNPLAEHSLLLLEQSRVDSSNAVNLFLAGEGDLNTIAAFWNAQRVSISKNNYLLPLTVDSDFDTLLQAILSVRHCEMLHIFSSLTAPEAERIQQTIKLRLENVGHSIPVFIVYKGFQYSMGPGRWVWDSEQTLTRGIANDGLLRFSIPVQVPVTGENIFGYDAVVELDSGNNLMMRPTGISTVLLLNSEERIEKARANEEGVGLFWIRRARRVRPRPAGIGGVSKPGEELCVYFHSDERIVQQTLLESGFSLRPNEHTRYAVGFVRRFGGFAKTMTFVHGGAVAILEALGLRRATQSGLFVDQIRSFLERDAGMDPARSQTTLKRFLPEMLSAGLVRRGIALRCSHCDLEEWYSIDSLSETIVCPGCLSTFQLQGEGPRYKYVSNELARRFITTGGHAVLRTAAVLQLMEASGQTQFGGDLYRIGERRAFAEVDLVRIIGDLLILAECKAYHFVGEQELIQIKESMMGTISAARAVGAQVVLLGLVTSVTDLRELHTMLEPIVETAHDEGIGIHLIMNDKFHAYGGTTAVDPRQIDVPRLDPSHERAPLEQTFGDLASGFGFGSLEVPGKEVLTFWDLKLAGPLNELA